MRKKWQIGEAYNLKLIRSTDRTDNVTFSDDENVFFMMDYFNFLKSVRLEKHYHGYKKLCGLKNEYSEGLAYQNIGIYRTWENKGNNDDSPSKELFKVSDSDSDQATERPFIGLILVYILDYKVKDGGNLKVCKLSDMGELLQYFRDLISSYIGLDEEKYSIFQTIAGADFCVVVRTDMLQEIYDAATNIMNIGNSDQKRVLFTYTNVGIECGKGKKLGEKTGCCLKLDSGVLNKNKNIRFAIRFRIENSVLKEMRKLQKQMSKKIEVVNGLFGRYDLVVRSDMDDFYEIYPYLYQNKVGALKPADNTEESSNTMSSIINEILLSAMRKGTIRTMNIRVLISIDENVSDDPSNIRPWFDEETQSEIIEAVNDIKNKYRDFQEKYKARFLMDKYWYQDICSIFERIINLYEGLAYEFDTYLNWRVYEEYLQILFQNINSYMENIQEDNRKAIGSFIGEFQFFIHAFDEYIKILQGVNQNTLQSPKYDAVVPCDGQKFLLSYTEYLSQISEQYCDYPWKEKKGACQDRRRAMKVLIFPEATQNHITVREVFRYEEKEKQIQGEDEKTNTGLLICRLPAFEYFARIYDMLPLITHEICHQMLILDRKVRNEFFIRELFQEISRQISYSLLREVGNKKNILVYDDLTWIFHNTLTECFLDRYKKEHPGWEKYAFNYIGSSIQAFLQDYIMFRDENDVFNKHHIGFKGLIQNLENFIYEFVSNNTDRKGYLDRLAEIQQGFKRQVELSRTEQYEKCAKERDNTNKKLSNLYVMLHERITIPDNAARIDIGKLRSLSSNRIGWKRMDDYLCNYYKEQAEKCCELNGTEDAEEMKQRLKYYVDNIRRLNVLYANLVEYEPRDYKKLEELLRTYVEKLQKEIKSSYIEGERYPSYSKDKIDQVTHLEILNADRALENLESFFRAYDFEIIEGNINRTTTLYRESCADIIMCGILGFTGFGYFRMSVTFWARMEHNDNEAIRRNYLLRQRLIAVLMILLSKENQELLCQQGEYYQYDIRELKQTIYDYADNQIDYAEKRVLEAVEREISKDKVGQKKKEKLLKECRLFFKIFRTNLAAIKRKIENSEKVFWKNGIWDALCKETHPVFEGAPEVKKYARQEINLYTRVIAILCMLSDIHVNGMIEIEKEYFDHLESIYSILPEYESIHPVVENVVDFYNQVDSESRFDNEQKMKDMLLFMQDHYFYNRYKNAQDAQERN